MSWLLALALGVACFLAATVAFDLLHFLLHRFAGSRFALLRRIGGLHQVHHEFLDRQLHSHHNKAAANISCHVVPEFVTQIAVTSGFLLVLPAAAVYVAWSIEVLVFLLILRAGGYDVNHRQQTVLAAYRPMYFCVPQYHYLHHVFPDAHFSSWIKTMDHLLQSGLSLQGRRLVVGGAQGACSRELSELLQRLGVKVVARSSTGADMASSVVADSLLVELGDGRADDAVALIRAFAGGERVNKAPREIWMLATRDAAVSSLAIARSLHEAPQINFRLLLYDPAREARQQARCLLRGLRRGYNVVPADWRASTLLRAWRFRSVRAVPLEQLGAVAT